MAYYAVKTCAACPTTFKANSNHQKYCPPCKPKVRKEKNKLWQHDHYMKNQEQKLEASRSYNKSEKGRASQMLRDAVRQGKIKRQPCEVCNEPEAQGHHDDYSKPLEVRWLCARHHRENHLFEPWMIDMREAGWRGGFLLGELIEAVQIRRDNPFHLIAGDYHVDYWKAQFGRKNTATGKTPEEAVARLWLALNKKTQ